MSWDRKQMANLYLWLITAAGAAALALLQPAWQREPEVLICLALLFGLAEYFPTRVKVGAISFSFPMAFAAYVLYGIPGAAWVAAAGTIGANLARRRAWRIALFNGAQFALAAVVAGWLTELLPGRPVLTDYALSTLIYTAVWYQVNNSVVDLVLWIRLPVYPLRDWLVKNKYEALSASVGLGYSLLMMVLADQQRGHDPLALTFFFLPLLTVGGFVRLTTSLAEFARQMTTLLDVSALSSVAQSEEQALDMALARLETFDHYHYTAIYLREGEELAARALRGLPPEKLHHVRIAIGEGLSGWAAREAQPAIAREARQDGRNAIGEGVQEGAAMLAAIPLVSGGTVLGVLTVGKERSHSLQPEDLWLLRIFANMTASVIRNFQLAAEREELLLVDERNRLSREIHDGLAQSLAGSLLQIDRVERLMEQDKAGAMRLLHILREQLRETLLDVRRSILNLRPPAVETYGLVESVRQELERLKSKGLPGEIDLRLEVRGEQRRLSALVEDELYRIAQEAVGNALQHAGPSVVTVGLHFFADRVRLTVRDDGQGFRLADAVRRSKERQRFGLEGMSERADRLGANFEIDSRPGAGTRLIVDVPLMGE